MYRYCNKWKEICFIRAKYHMVYKLRIPVCLVASSRLTKPLIIFRALTWGWDMIMWYTWNTFQGIISANSTPHITMCILAWMRNGLVLIIQLMSGFSRPFSTSSSVTLCGHWYVILLCNRVYYIYNHDLIALYESMPYQTFLLPWHF